MTTELKACPFCGETWRGNLRRCIHCEELIGPPSRESVFSDQTDVEQLPAGDFDALTTAYLGGAELRGAYLSGMDLFNADLASADLRGADLGGSRLINADLSGADLRGSNLYGADLSDAKLVGADLSGANLTNTDLSGAVYNGFTKWPDDFDPQSAGAINTAHD